MTHKLLAALIALPLAGCSTNSLLPSSSEQFQVDSVPVGASVKVLGESMGQTPMTLSTRDVFPQSFAHEKQHLYGRIELTYPGCEPSITTVSSRIISHGLKTKLKCRDNAQATDQIQTKPTTATVTPTPASKPVELKLRLKKLKELYQEELISEEEYAEKRRALLEEL